MQKLIIRRSIRRAAKRKPEYLKPETVSIRRWTAKHHGNESRTDWITRQILEAIEQDESTAEGVFISPDLEISLDERGIFNHFDLLTGFFGDDETIAVYRNFRSRNKLLRFYEDTERAAEDMPPEKKKELLRIWKAYKPQDATGREVRRNMLDIVKRSKRAAERTVNND